MPKDYEGLRWTPKATVRKFDDDGNFIEEIICEGNLVVTAGLERLADLIIGTSSATLDSTRVRLGVGDDATGAVVGDTDLSTTTNQYYQIMEATFPTAVGAVITFKASFGVSDANFTWACWGLDVGTPTVTSSGTVATLVNRKVNAFGTKSGGTWELTVTVTLS